MRDLNGPPNAKTGKTQRELEDQTRQLGAPNRLNWAVVPAPGTLNAPHDFINCSEGLHMMHMHHAMPACGGVWPLRPMHVLNMGVQTRQTAGCTKPAVLNQVESR